MWIILNSYVHPVELICYLVVAIIELLLLAICLMLINTMPHLMNSIVPIAKVNIPPEGKG